MDTSEQLYAGHDLEMIRKAVEIQQKASTGVGNIWYHPSLGIAIATKLASCLCGCTNETAFCYIKTGNVELLEDINIRMTWLPRQDQLWPIIPKKVKYIDFERDVKFTEGIGLRIYAKIPIKPGVTDHWDIGGYSVEQLLLKLFYKASFNKTWDGKEWT